MFTFHHIPPHSTTKSRVENPHCQAIFDKKMSISSKKTAQCTFEQSSRNGHISRVSHMGQPTTWPFDGQGKAKADKELI
jgi:hypothetical protein